ncbi:hypothetical protein KSP39_PZI005188 [Platanthera zijinensis]|uniref:Uncharacterized protein n=1 Tax=Platanthera zijinensis TaxID=2320716 RepID=A0AAP0BUS3_9ASPA
MIICSLELSQRASSSSGLLGPILFGGLLLLAEIISTNNHPNSQPYEETNINFNHNFSYKTLPNQTAL